MAASPRLPLVIVLPVAVTLLGACNFPKPADVAGEAGPSDASVSADAATDGPSIDSPVIDAAPDAPDPPGTVLHVSPTGDDGNDGLTMPVKTLKHAIGLAAANSAIRSIVLASGRYSTAGGETFPYTVPANVSVVGPAGGGAILTGTKAEIGMTVDTGELKDLELEDFTVAITANGTAHLKSVRVRTNMIGVRAETGAKVTADDLDITGATAACATGIVLNGAADLVATALATRGLGATINAKDQSTVNIVNANITGDPTCTSAVMMVTSNKTFRLTDSLVDGGNDGINLGGGATTPQMDIMNTILRNLKGDALVSMSGVTLTMTGGELSNNGRGGLEATGGVYSFINVSIKDNVAFGVYFQKYDSRPFGLKMRGCDVSGASDGVYLSDDAIADLGTAVSPGNNTFLSSQRVGVDIAGSLSGGPTQIDAVGNTWRPGTQGADSNGRYNSPANPISGTVAVVLGNNYAIAVPAYRLQLNPPLSLSHRR